MNGSKVSLLSLLLGAWIWLCANQAAALPVTGFYYTSSPESWVGGGGTVVVLPSDGFSFQMSTNFDGGVSFGIDDFASNPDIHAERWWYLHFAAPQHQKLQVGHYAGATRWPFQDLNEPGLAFYGNGRGSNELTGYFDILEIRYGPGDLVIGFAADFTQYDETHETWWNTGGIRFNSSAPLITVPEPHSLGLFVIGAVMLRRHVTRKCRSGVGSNGA